MDEQIELIARAMALSDWPGNEWNIKCFSEQEQNEYRAQARAAHSVMAGRVAELEGVVAAFADGADKCAEAPHFIVQPFLAIFTKHSAAIASARRAALAHPKGME